MDLLDSRNDFIRCWIYCEVMVDRIDYKAKWNTYFRDNKLLKLNAISVLCHLLRWKK